MYTYLNQRPPGHPLLEGQKGVFVPLKRTHLTGQIQLPFADMYLEQHFLYTAEEHNEPIQAMYRFPLPGNAAVKEVSVSFGNTTVTTVLKKRKEAEKQFEQAVEEEKQAALVTQEAPNVFTLRVSGIHPDELVKVTTHYIQILRPQQGGYEFRLPLTTAPRYVRDDEVDSRYAQGQPLAVMRDPQHRFSMHVATERAATITSSTHEIHVEENRVTLEDVVPDTDLVLSFSLKREHRPSLRLFTHKDGGYVYFAALAAPPTSTQKVKQLSFLEVIDHSGSMGTPQVDGSKWSISDFIAKMTYREAKDIATNVHIGVFDTNTWWKKVENQEELEQFLQEGYGGGGTHLGKAIEQGIYRHDGKGVPYNVVITDAQVTDYGRLLRLADTIRKKNQRFVMVCVDTAPNSYIPLEMARRTDGLAFFLSSAAEGDMINAVDHISNYWKAPIGHVKLRVESDEEAVDIQHSQGLHQGNILELGDLLANMPRWAVGRVKVQNSPRLTFTLLVDGKQVDTVRIDGGDHNEIIKDIFGIHRVSYLEALLNARHTPERLTELLESIGYDLELPDYSEMIYSDNKLKMTQESLDELLATIALEFGLASKETAFIAVTEKEGKVVDRVIVPSALPEGWMPPQHAQARKAQMQPFVAQAFAMKRDEHPPKPSQKPIFTGATKKGVFFTSEDNVQIRAIEVHGEVPEGAKLFVYRRDDSSPVAVIDLKRVSQIGKRPVHVEGYVRLESNTAGVHITVS